MAFPTTGVLDTFNRADASISGSACSNGIDTWSSTRIESTGGTTIQIVSNQISGNAATGSAYISSRDFEADCEVYVDVVAMPGTGTVCSLVARANDEGTTTWDGYKAYLVWESGQLRMRLFSAVNGTETSIDWEPAGVAAGDSIGIQLIGSQINFWRRILGVWTNFYTINDSTHTGAGRIGVECADATTLDSFGGGTVSATPVFPSTPILDTFTGSDETPIATNWSVPAVTGDNSARRLSNQFAPAVAGGWSGAYYDARAFGSDCECYVTVATLGVSTVWVRGQTPGTSGADGYIVHYEHGAPSRLLINRLTNAASTQLQNVIITTLSAGDGIGISAVGSTIQSWVRRSGVWSLISSVIDTTYPDAGYLAAEVNGTVARLDDFGGGSIPVAFPTTPILDNFNGPNETPIATNWTTPMYTGESSGPDRWLNKMDFTAGSAYYDIATFGPDVEAYTTVATKWTFGHVELRVRAQGVGGSTAAASYYFVRWWYDNDFVLGKIVAGTPTDLVTGNRTFSTGDKFGISVVGTTLSFWHYTAGSWTEFATTTDSSITSAGRIGIESDDGGTDVDDFGGGTYSLYAAEVLTDGPVAYYRMDESEFSTIVSDNFNRADENPLAGDWTIPVTTNPMKIVSNSATYVTNDNNNDGAIYDGITFPDNQWSAAKLSVSSTIGVRSGPALHVRHASAANTSYRFSTDHAASTNCNISRFVANTRTTILDFTQAWTDGDEWKLAVDGPASAARLRVYLNGALIQTVTDNSSIASGYPGIGVSDNASVTNVVIDDWQAGEVVYLRDSSGLAHHATSALPGGVVYHDTSPIVTDPSDWSIYYSGTWFDVPDHDDLDLGDGPLSVEAWIIASSWTATGAAKVISGKGDGCLTWFVNNADSKFTAAKANGGIIVASTTTIPVDTWTHVVYTKNGATSKIYIDGVDRTGTVTNLTLANSATPLVIGMDYAHNYNFVGAMDEMAFYKTVLSPERVLAHYEAAIEEEVEKQTFYVYRRRSYR